MLVELLLTPAYYFTAFLLTFLGVLFEYFPIYTVALIIVALMIEISVVRELSIRIQKAYSAFNAPL